MKILFFKTMKILMMGPFLEIFYYSHLFSSKMYYLHFLFDLVMDFIIRYFECLLMNFKEFDEFFGYLNSLQCQSKD